MPSGFGASISVMSNFEQLVARPDAILTGSRESTSTARMTSTLNHPPTGEKIVDDDRLIGSTTAIGAAKKTPSLALALVPRPELFPATSSSQAPDCNAKERSERTDVGPFKEPPGEA